MNYLGPQKGTSTIYYTSLCVLRTVTELLCDVFVSSSISNRVALARAVHIERLMKTNKVRTEHLSHTQYSSPFNLYGSEEGQGSVHM